MNKTYSAKPSEVKRNWYLIDASESSLGRISTQAARLLIGKDKPMNTAHIDCGDYVVIINASALKVTGNKLKSKSYHRHSQHPGGLHSRRLEEQLIKDPTVAVLNSIKGMLPDNKLRPGRLLRLKIYSNSEHDHSAQKPQIISLIKEGR